MNRFIKIVCGLILTLILIGVFGMILFHTPPVQRHIISYISNEFERQTGWTISMEGISYFPPFSVRAQNVQISQGDNLKVSFEHLHGIFLLHKLKEHNFRLDDFTISGLRVEGVDLPNLNLIGKGGFELYKGFIEADISVSSGTGLPLNLHVHSDNVYNQEILVMAQYHDQLHLQAKLNKIPGEGMKIQDIEGKVGPLFLSGNLIVNKQLQFEKDSELSFALTDAVKMHPLLTIKGTPSCKARLLGNIYAPNVETTLDCEGVLLGELPIDKVNVKGKINSGRDSWAGNLDLSFEWKAHPFHFPITFGYSGANSWFTTDLNLGHILPLLLPPEMPEFEGNVAVTVSFSKSSNPYYDIQLKNGRLEGIDSGILLQNLKCTMKGSGNRLVLNDLTGDDGKEGKVSGKGYVNLDIDKGFPFHLDLSIQKCKVLQLDYTDAVGSGNLIMEGNKDSALLTGTLTADLLEIKLPEKGSGLADLLDIAYPSGYEEEFAVAPRKPPEDEWNLNFDLKAVIPGNGTISSEQFQSTWEGNLQIKGNDVKPLLIGEIKNREGKAEVNGKTFTITQGTITINGDVEKDVNLYVAAETELDRTKIEMTLKGPVDNLEISLRSNPPLAQREILSMLLFGKTMTDITPFESNQLNLSLKSLKSGSNKPDPFSRFKNSLGIDKLDINPGFGAETERSVGVGKYITNYTCVSITRRFSNDANRTSGANVVGIETELTKNIKVQAEVDDESIGQINLLWKRDY